MMCGLTVGRIAPQKGQDILVQALAELPADFPWEWHFVGRVTDGSFARRLKTLAKQLEVADKLQWHGELPKAEVKKSYGQANIFALPSRWEGQPNAVLEAMAAKLPVMAGLTHGIAELLEEKDKCLKSISPNTPAQWTNAFMAFWQERDKLEQQVNEAYELVLTRTWKRAAKQHVDIYEKISQALERLS